MSERNIFMAAVRLADPDERAAYLDRACGSPALRARIDELLAAHAESDSLLDQPDEATADFPRPDAAAETADLGTDRSTSDYGGPAPAEAGSGTFPAVPGYEVLRELGRGGMGVVYLARQTAANRPVALKVIRGAGYASAAERARFRAEAEAVARLRHPGIVQVYEVGEHDGTPFFTLEYCAGGTLAERLDGTPWTPSAAARLVEAIADAADAAHRAGIVHRDLKPANILFETDNPAAHAAGSRNADPTTVVFSDPRFDPAVRPKVTDFGLAKRTDGPDGPTVTGAIMGTPSYMAPEQALGASKSVGPPADVWALGAVLYELLTGRPPFKADTALATIALVKTQEPVAVRALTPGSPRDLETIVHKCLQKEPARRYATARELGDDLRRFREGRPILARPVGPGERAWRWCRRNPTVAALLAAVFVSSTTGTVVSLLKADEARQEEKAKGAALEDVQKAKVEVEHKAVELGAALGRETVTKARVESQKGEIEQALQKADASDLEKGKTLGDLLVGTGAELLDRGDFTGAYLQFAEALRVDGRDPIRAELHRVRLAATARECPRMAHFWLHAGTVNDAAFSPDGTRVVTVGDAEARVWDAVTGKAIAALPHRHPVVKIGFSPDGRRFFTVSGTNSPPNEPAEQSFTVSGASNGLTPWEVRVWATDTGAQLVPPVKHVTARVLGKGLEPVFDVTGGRLFVYPDDRVVQAVDPATGKPVGPALRHTGPVSRVALGPNGLIATVSTSVPDDDPKPNTVRVWNAETGQAVGKPWEAERQSQVLMVGFNRNGAVLVAKSAGLVADPKGANIERKPAGVVAYDPTTGNVAWQWSLPVSKPVPGANASLDVKLSIDGRLLFVSPPHGAGDAGTTMPTWVLDAGTGEPVTERPGGPSAGSRLVVARDGARAADLGTDNAVRIWNARTAAPHGSTGPLTGKVLRIEFDRAGERLLVATSDGFVRVWSPAGEPLTPLLPHEGAVKVAAFSPDGRHVLTASGRGVRVWPTAIPRTTISELPQLVARARISPDGRQVLSAELDAKGKAVVLRDARTGTATTVARPGPRDNFFPPFFTKDGSGVVYVTEAIDPARPLKTQTVNVWDVATAKPLGEYRGTLFGKVARADGRRWLFTAITPPQENTVTLWSPGEDRTVRVRGADPLGPPPWGEFSADGRRVALAEAPSGGISQDVYCGPIVSVCDATSGELLGQIRPSTHLPNGLDQVIRGRLFRMALSPAGDRVLTVLLDGTVRVWAADGKPVTPPMSVGPVPYSGIDEAMGGGFSPDGKRVLAAGGGDDGSGQARVWDATTGEPVTPFLRHDAQIHRTSFSPDGRRVVTASRDGAVRVWDAATGAPVARPLRLPGAISGVWFDDSGRRLFALYEPGTFTGPDVPRLARVWDVETGRPLTPPLRSSQSVAPVSALYVLIEPRPGWFSADGRTVLLLQPPNRLSVVALDPDQRPVAEIVGDAELLSARRVTSGGVAPIEPGELYARGRPGATEVPPAPKSEEPAWALRESAFNDAMRAKDWKGAAAALQKLTGSGEATLEAQIGLAPLLLYAGDADGYRAHRTALLRLFGDEEADIEAVARTVKACSLLPAGVKEREAIQKLAARVAARTVAAPRGGSGAQLREESYRLAMGLEHFRTGEDAEAERALRGVGGPWEVVVPAQLVLAMVLHRTGKADDAKKLFDRTVLTMARFVPKPGSPSFPKRWSDAMLCHVLHKEAEAVLGGK